MKFLLVTGITGAAEINFVGKLKCVGSGSIKIVHNPSDAVLSLCSNSPDILIMDISVAVRADCGMLSDHICRYSRIPVIYAGHDTEAYFSDVALPMASSGYILYSDSQEQIAEVVRSAFEHSDLLSKTFRQTDMLNTVLNASGTGIAILSETGKVKRYNNRFFEILRVRPSAEENIEMLTGGAITIETVLRIIQTQKPEIAASGSGRNCALVHISADVCEWYSGLMIILIITDLTKIYQTGCSIETTENIFEKVFNDKTEPAVIAGCSGYVITAANKAFMDLYGINEFSAVGRSLVEYLGMELTCMINGGLENCRQFDLSRVEQRNSEGEAFIADLAVSKMLFDGTEHFMIEIRDVSERVKADEVRCMIQDRLFHTHNAVTLGALVSCIAHEINNPNNFIMFNGSLMMGCIDSLIEATVGFGVCADPSISAVRDDINNLVAGMVRGSERIKYIIDDLKDFTMSGKGGIFCKMSLNEAVIMSVRLLEHKIREATDGFRLVLPDEACWVYGHQQRLVQVIFNILLNAVEALKGRNCLLEVRCTPGDSHVIEIRDEGVGIDEKNMNKLFTPYFSTKSNKEVSGLGLFIANSIIAEHRGTLEIRSIKNKGTTVTITIPSYKNERIQPDSNN